MIPRRTMRSFIARVSEQLDPRFATSRHATSPIRDTMHAPRIARTYKLLLTSHPVDGMRLCSPGCLVRYRLPRWLTCPKTHPASILRVVVCTTCVWSNHVHSSKKYCVNEWFVRCGNTVIGRRRRVGRGPCGGVQTLVMRLIAETHRRHHHGIIPCSMRWLVQRCMT